VRRPLLPSRRHRRFDTSSRFPTVLDRTSDSRNVSRN
jgi:hypothetical protein